MTCPECGGQGARGCGARWHDGRPDNAPSPANEARMADLFTDEDRLCGCGDVLNGTLGAKCGNCQAADLTVLESRAERAEAELTRLRTEHAALRQVARRLRDGWRPGKSMAVVIAGSPRPEPEHIWMAPTFRQDSVPMSPAQRAVLDHLDDEHLDQTENDHA